MLPNLIHSTFKKTQFNIFYGLSYDRLDTVCEFLGMDRKFALHIKVISFQWFEQFRVQNHWVVEKIQF
jgi:hypothetical protein